MSSVSGVFSSSLASSYDLSGMQKRQRPDAAQMAEDLFSKLDTTGKGYIEQSDLSSALSNLSSLSGASGSTDSASEIFSQLDSDSDGKVTKDELSASLQKLSESLDDQFNQMRMAGAMPPPPPSGQAKASDEGFTEEELNSQLSEIGSTDSARSSLISKIVENFDAADTNEDGKVSFAEAMAYDQSNPTTSSTSSDSTSANSSVASSEQTDAKVFRQLMDLLRTYGSDERSSQSAAAALLSVSA